MASCKLEEMQSISFGMNWNLTCDICYTLLYIQLHQSWLQDSIDLLFLHILLTLVLDLIFGEIEKK